MRGEPEGSNKIYDGGNFLRISPFYHNSMKTSRELLNENSGGFWL